MPAAVGSGQGLYLKQVWDPMAWVAGDFGYIREYALRNGKYFRVSHRLTELDTGIVSVYQQLPHLCFKHD